MLLTDWSVRLETFNEIYQKSQQVKRRSLMNESKKKEKVSGICPLMSYAIKPESLDEVGNIYMGYCFGCHCAWWVAAWDCCIIHGLRDLE
jgi:dienelactone hydrolase